MAVATTDPVRLAPAPRIPKLLTGVGFVAAREKSVAALAKRYGSAYTLRLPIFGQNVVVSAVVPTNDQVGIERRPDATSLGMTAREEVVVDVGRGHDLPIGAHGVG